MTLKKFTAAGALALGIIGAAGPAFAGGGGGGVPHPYFGGPDVVSPTSVDGNGVLNNLLSINICGSNIIPIELLPIVSPTTASCEDSQNDDTIKVKRDKFHH